MLKLLISIFTLLLTSSYACEISGPAFVIYNSAKDQNSALKSLSLQKCSEKQISDIHGILSDFEGVIRKRTILAELPGSAIKIKKSITIKRLETLLNEKVELPKGWRLIKPQLLGLRERTLGFKKNSIVSVECHGCDNTGLKNLKLEINDPIDSNKRVVWIKASVAVKTSVLQTTRVLNVNHQGIKPGSVSNAEIYSTTPEAYFTNSDQLVFYKVNKGIKRGQPIKFTDLSALNLVKPGQLVRTNLKSGVIKLKGTATPVRAGKLGEVIQLRNNNSKKIIIGRVTDFNEVEVEL